VYESRQQWAELSDVLTQWIALHPQDGGARYRLALILATRDPAAAVDELNALASQQSEGSAQAQALADVISRGLEQGGETFALARVGEYLLRAGEPRLAQSAFEAALGQNPGYGEALAYLGLAREQAGQPAAPDYAQAVVLSPDSPQAHLLYGAYLSRQGELAHARLELDRAWMLDPHSWSIAAARGRLEFAAGDLSAAETWYAQAVQVAPDSEEAWLERAAFYIGNQIRIGSDGIASAREALARAPSDPRALDLLGLAWYLQGDLPLAERMFWRAVSVEPTYAAAFLHLGMLSEGRGDREAARAYYEAALRLARDDALGDQAQTALARLP
jgi:tetratricopeptide (TPR) repeat protein